MHQASVLPSASFSRLLTETNLAVWLVLTLIGRTEDLITSLKKVNSPHSIRALPGAHKKKALPEGELFEFTT